MKKYFVQIVAGALAITLAGCATAEKTAAVPGDEPRLIEAVTYMPPQHKEVEFFHTDGDYRIKLGKNDSSFGKWTFIYELPDRVTGCHFRVEHDMPKLAAANLLPVRVSWLDADRVNLQSSYLEPAGATAYTRLLRRPEGARYVALNCGIRFAPGKEVTYRNISCAAATVPERPVRLAVVKNTPKGNDLATCEDNQLKMEAVFKQVLADGEKLDLIVFPETLLTRGVPNLGEGKGAQPVPGPHTEWLGEYARKLNSNVIASLREKDGTRYYNTAVVIDRQGKIIGRYRKTQFTVGEYEKGYDWGTELPVFELDCGKVGVLICWDLWYPEAARILRLKGAEIIAYPIASTSAKFFDPMWSSRAVENGIYLAAGIAGPAGRCPARVVGPDGSVLAETWKSQTYAAVTIDLSRPVFLPWLSVGPGAGENGNFYMFERHPGLYGDLAVKK